MPRITMPKDHQSAAVVLPNGEIVERGKTAEVDADLAAALAEQGWTPVATKSPTKGDKPTASTDADPKES